MIDNDISMNEELPEAISVVEKIAPRNQSNKVRATQPGEKQATQAVAKIFSGRTGRTGRTVELLL